MEEPRNIGNRSAAIHARALGDLLESVGDVDSHYIEQVASGSLRLQAALEQLNYVAEWLNRGKAVHRGRTILKAAYLNYPTDNYSHSYIEKMMVVVPKLLSQRVRFHPDVPLEKHLSRLDLWLNGADRLLMAELEGQSYETVHAWPKRAFPHLLKNKLTFYDIAHSADRLWDAEELLDAN